MTQFDQLLNLTSNAKLTNSVWDTDVAQWMSKNQMYIQTAMGVWTPLMLDASGYLPTIVKNSSLPTGAATQATLAEVLAKIIAAPATETTIASILTQLGTTGVKKIIDALPVGANVIGKIGIDQTIPGATNAMALISGIESTVAAPIVGTKSVMAIAAEIFAGASVKANRRKLIIRNEDPILRLRIGPASVTQQNGYPIEPGATINIQFDPATSVAIYAISEGAALNTAVVEV